MAAHNPHLVAQYAARFSLAELTAEFACLGFELHAAPGFAWDGRAKTLLEVGERTPVIRALPRADALEITLLPWGIPYRGQSQSAPLFNFHAGTENFRLSARVLAPLSAFAGKSKRPTLQMVAGIERQGAWTMLTRETAVAEDGAAAMRLAAMAEPTQWKAWLMRGDLSGD